MNSRTEIYSPFHWRQLAVATSGYKLFYEEAAYGDILHRSNTQSAARNFYAYIHVHLITHTFVDVLKSQVIKIHLVR